MQQWKLLTVNKATITEPVVPVACLLSLPGAWKGTQQQWQWWQLQQQGELGWKCCSWCFRASGGRRNTISFTAVVEMNQPQPSQEPSGASAEGGRRWPRPLPPPGPNTLYQLPPVSTSPDSGLTGLVILGIFPFLNSWIPANINKVVLCTYLKKIHLCLFQKLK